VNRTPGEGDSLKKAMNAAYRILSLRARSEEELREKLQTKGFNHSLIDEVISSMREKSYVNDSDFAQNLARYLLRNRSYGLIRIAEELRKKGIPSEIIRNTMSGLKGEVDEKEMVIHSLKVRLRGSDYSRMAEREKKRIVDYLYRKGFPLSKIYEVLKSKNRNSCEDDRE
jgi:regulatory protein